jgi:hypothetical protein
VSLANDMEEIITHINLLYVPNCKNKQRKHNTNSNGFLQQDYMSQNNQHLLVDKNLSQLSELCNAQYYRQLDA